MHCHALDGEWNLATRTGGVSYTPNIPANINVFKKRIVTLQTLKTDIQPIIKLRKSRLYMERERACGYIFDDLLMHIYRIIWFKLMSFY